MVSPQMMKLMIGFVENNALAGNYTDPDTEEIIVVEGEEQWKGIHTIMNSSDVFTNLCHQFFSV